MKQLLIILLAMMPILNLYSQIEKSERYNRGWDKLKEIDGDAGEKVASGLIDISPELVQFMVEYSFGDVYNLTKLENKQKEIVAISSLLAQRAIPEMKVHFNGALNTGNTINEVKEVVLQMSGYVGFPKSICAMNTLQEVLSERKEKGAIDEIGMTIQSNPQSDRLAKGSKELAQLDANQEEILRNHFDHFSPELVRFTIEYGYGDVYSRSNLDRKSRQIATIVALATLGNAPSQLKFHIKAGLTIGLSIDEIKEIMLLMTVYSGFPAAINGMNILKEAVEE